MDISILIATYGEEAWRDLAWSRAYPSADAQGAREVLVRHHKNGTISQVRNRLGKQAKSEWLCFLDADDELAPGYLNAMRAKAERRRKKKTLLQPAVTYVSLGGQKLHPRVRRMGNLHNDNYLVVGTLVQRDLFLEVGGFGDYPHGFEDWSLWAKCWKSGAEIVQVPEAIYIAHLNPKSKHRLAWRDRATQAEMHQKVRREIFPELYPA